MGQTVVHDSLSLSRRRSGGEGDGENAALVGFAFDGDGALAGVDDEFGDAQAQAAAFGTAGQAPIHLVEAAEDLLQGPARNAEAVGGSRNEEFPALTQRLFVG